MRIKGDKPPKFSTFVKEQGISPVVARAYQKSLGQVKAMIGRFQTMTREKFGGAGMKFDIPRSIYQMDFKKWQSVENKNDYLMSQLVELKQMQTFQGLAGMHQQKLDSYMVNVAKAMQESGYSPDMVREFLNKYQSAKEADRQDYINGRPPQYRQWEFAAKTGGRAIEEIYKSKKGKNMTEEAEMGPDITPIKDIIIEFIS